MHHDQTDLDRLADRVGIEPSYWDIWGNFRLVSAETKRAIVAAMGLPAASDAEIAASLGLVTARPWRRLLEPVHVLGEAEPVTVTFAVADRVGGATVSWDVVEEGGATHQGESPLYHLEVVERTVLDGMGHRRCRLTLPLGLPLGYHRLKLEVRGAATQEGATTLIIAPERCLTPDELVPGGHLWGIGLQLYALRSGRDWGVGDFGDLARFTELAAGLGAGMVGLNPLHALFPADPNHFGPYSPSNRSFLNILAIDVTAVPDLSESAEARALIAGGDFQQRLAAARGAELVDYPAVSGLKLPVLERLYHSFRLLHLDTAEPSARGHAFRAFQQGMGQQEMGPALRRQAIFEALHEHLYHADPAQWDWHGWPEPLRHPNSPEVAAFATEHAGRVEFFEYLQWLADGQLAAAAAAARAAGMPVGLYCDLAVANHPGGAAAWANPEVVLSGASVGAPPDMFNPKGQNWGLAPLSPVGLREAAYAPFIHVLRANMRHAGALRIDHVMALQHLFWIPAGTEGEGAYVTYPLQDLTRIVALESRRNRCLVIGEDLGTVPEGFRPAMARAGILSYRVLYFERDGQGNFLPPEAYPEDALVTVTTHDLATFAGFWQGRDLDWRTRLGLYPSEDARNGDAGGREHDRWRLLEALARAGVLPDSQRDRHAIPEATMELVAAVYRYLAKTPGRVLNMQIEDAIGEIEQPNLPGTVDQHPNWRRRLRLTLEEMGAEMATAEGLRTLALAVGPGRTAAALAWHGGGSG